MFHTHREAQFGPGTPQVPGGLYVAGVSRRWYRSGWMDCSGEDRDKCMVGWG